MTNLDITNNSSEPIAYTVKEFARYFKGKDSNWVRRLIAQKKIKAINGFGEILVPASEINRILNQREEGGE